ncbi:amino acid ABC transporter substrate-binding protein [soil metagenome]
MSLTAIAAAGALALAGCSGGVASQGGGSSNTSAAAGACSTLLIGAPFPFSGPFSEIATTGYQGTELAVDQINKAGGIKALGGAKLSLQKGDTSSLDTTQASSAATKLISDGAIALNGAWATTLTAPIAPVAERAQVPLLTQAWADTLSQQGYKYYFQPPAKSSQLGASGAQYVIDAAKAAGVSFATVAVVAPNDVANQTQYNGAAKTFADQGAKVPKPVFYQTGITDVTPIVNTISSEKPDLILTGGSPADATLIVKGLRAAGITVPMMSFGGAFSGTAPSFAKSLGDAVNGLTVVTNWNGDLPLDGVKEAATAYEAKYGTTYMPDLAGESWVNTYLIAAALEKAKSCKPADIATALRSLDEKSGPASAIPGDGVSFTDAGTNPNAVPILLQWQDGVPKTIWPSKYASAKFTD